MTSYDDRRYERISGDVLVLTDGSDQAKRKAEWEVVFADSSETTIHRLDVLGCFDSGVVVRRYGADGRNGRGRRKRAFTDASSRRAATRNREHAPEIDVLHGVPHEALLGYVVANAIERILVTVREKTALHRSFIGQTLADVSRFATVPVIERR